MDSTLGLSQPQIFACPKCGEMINTSMTHCAFCHTPVDPQWAAWAANAQTAINSAFSHANNIMLAARGMVALMLASFIPCGGNIAAIALIVMIFTFPLLVLIWFAKYQWGLQGIDKNHNDLKQSRARILKASIIWAVTIVAWPLIAITFGVIVAVIGS
ncbi:MAG: hypothetical protein L0Y75_09055 [Acidobacteria bacterium]|nr:hypothetical protein [Acidobacteriota bacterium]